ncbi:electron transfer flavoprotein-ubiquinone oxidoreductase [Radicibacter daui]|uniref:electron transfer flavoprotein-ubiquinone oxidoreductase n=1 Tax=Radicibacter daui TaxID=3064829 RepID=UPI004046FBF1
MERESMEFDVVIVGAGPAGLGAAIRLKQRAAEAGREISVCVLEKGSEVGAHILSGAVMQPDAINELFPDWKERGAPLNTPVTQDEFHLLTQKGKVEVPHFLLPSYLHNAGNYIISLGNLCRWLAEQAEALGVEVYPGFAAAEVLYDDKGKVRGVATGDMGVARDGSHKDSYQPGMELHARYTLIAEGVRGSLAKQIISRYELARESQPQTYGLGIKELWEVDPAKHQPGKVMHCFGWPMDLGTYGGGFIYHLEDNQVAIGYVVGLDYKNPYLSPFEEMQRFKTHPSIAPLFEGARRLAYGARAINEGGLQSIPKLTFPGGALIGCSAGFVNVPKIKGSHNAMKTGMLAADAAFEALAAAGDDGVVPDELTAYPEAFRKSWVWKELNAVRNCRPAFRWGLVPGLLMSGIELWLKGRTPWTLRNHRDNETLMAKEKAMPIDYPKPDGKLTFDRLSSVFLSNTNHEEDQPVHLRLADPAIAVNHNLRLYGGPEQRYCPAGVYEFVEADGGGQRLQINAQNCVHCKTCDIKDPMQNITWTVPEGGGGPNYPNM